MRFKQVYLDNGASTQVDPLVIIEMNKYHQNNYANSSSTHSFGQDAKQALENARKRLAKLLKAKPEEIIFTSGGTESNNFAIKGIAFANKDKNHIITTKVEHKCVLQSCKWLESQGYEVTYLNVDPNGFVKPEDLENAITDKTILFSVIHGNNEIGTIQDLTKLYEICKKHNVYLHTDACQSFTKTEITSEHADLITLNAHKIHGPKGVGALYIKKGVKIKQWQHGGDHEFAMRAGTENIPGIIGFVKSAELATNQKHVEHITKLRNKLIDGILKIPEVRLNGPLGKNRLCNNANFSFKSIEGEALGGYLDQKNVCSSTGSACTSKVLEPSHVLKGIGLSDEDANGSLRLTLSRFTTEDEIDYVLEVIPNIITKLRRISPIGRLIKNVLKKSN